MLSSHRVCKKMVEIHSHPVMSIQNNVAIHLCFSDCVTTSGKVIGKKCVFPFIFRGTTCAGPKCCTLGGIKNWCSVQVDENGLHVGGIYGLCGGTPCDAGKNIFSLLCHNVAVQIMNKHIFRSWLN